MGMSGTTRTKLSIMMFLTYAFNGIWSIPLGSYMNRVGYSGIDIGTAYSTVAVGCIIAPFFMGMIADKFFAAQKVLGVLNILASCFLVAAAHLSVGPDGKANVINGHVGLGLFYWMLLAHFICYMPTWALTNTIAFRQMDNPGKQFPGIRVMGTIGFIVVSATTLFGEQLNRAFNTTENFEVTVAPMYIGAVLGFILGVISFFLPSTPPEGRGKQLTFADIVGVKALSLLKDRNYAVFALSSFLIMFAAYFYWNWANVYLNESNMKYSQFWQSTGQMSETIFLFIMPWFFIRLGVRKMLLLGLFSWILRFVCFSYGVWGSGTAALVVLGLLLHGPCYDFFFVTGQLYTDSKASKDIQAQAQGLISLITVGLGSFFGSMISGLIVDHYAIKAVVEGVEKISGHNWHVIWFWPIGIMVVIIVLFFTGFHDQIKVGHDVSSSPTEGENKGA